MSIQQPEPVGFIVTLKDVYDQMHAGFQKVDQMAGQLTAMTGAQEATRALATQLDGRVRALETAQARLWGGLALLSALLIGGGTWVAIIISRH